MMMAKGMYNSRPQAVCEPTLLQKDPRCSLETAVPSSREATARARAHRPNCRWGNPLYISSPSSNGFYGSGVVAGSWHGESKMPTNREERDACLAVTLSGSPSAPSTSPVSPTAATSSSTVGNEMVQPRGGAERRPRRAARTSGGSSRRECGDHRLPVGRGTATEERSVGEKEELNDERISWPPCCAPSQR